MPQITNQISARKSVDDAQEKQRAERLLAKLKKIEKEKKFYTEQLDAKTVVHSTSKENIKQYVKLYKKSK